MTHEFLKKGKQKVKNFLKTRCNSLYGLVLTVLCIIFFYTPAMGQDQTGGQSLTVEQMQTDKTAKNKTADEVKIETITVTAQKKEENIQDVAMSLSVFSDQMIEEAGIGESSELLRFAPNVYVRDVGSNHQTIIRWKQRGKNQPNSSDRNQP